MFDDNGTLKLSVCHFIRSAFTIPFSQIKPICHFLIIYVFCLIHTACNFSYVFPTNHEEGRFLTKEGTVLSRRKEERPSFRVHELDSGMVHPRRMSRGTVPVTVPVKSRQPKSSGSRLFWLDLLIFSFRYSVIVWDLILFFDPVSERSRFHISTV